MPFQTVEYKEFSKEGQREIVFKDITTGEITHKTLLDASGGGDWRGVIGYFTQTIMKDLRLDKRLRCALRQSQRFCSRQSLWRKC